MDSKRMPRDSAKAVKTGKSLATRGRILAAARDLFNEQGTAAVSTNHIAAAAGLSPGNLYYHFSDKKQIIRGLLDEYVAEWTDRWDPSPDAQRNLETLAAGFARGARLSWENRFFGREILALLQADGELRAVYDAAYRRRLGEWSAFAEQLVAQGLMRAPEPPGTLADLTVAIWLISESWLGFLDVTGDPRDPAQVGRGLDLVKVVLAPYLTPAALRVLSGGTTG
ncbi:TetR family transcriptional regulator [Acrocarpospora phusangensis]|uniref:TetR family transcriptional regulator n=1 Tax=Acrocarpospora phusangensis TaxID=1070424 RepID=A0A919Q4G4_9ACTN|nr:TetR/AcrR family transcriptional regulator [Acrocarpospora phusangensis]GIH21728.1 TetR family transcriptional regulator [Acrocarpospora phusangensis]